MPAVNAGGHAGRRTSSRSWGFGPSGIYMHQKSLGHPPAVLADIHTVEGE
jgi:hypothetical protein